MKITSQHLDAVRGLLVAASSKLDDQTKAAKAAVELRDSMSAQARSLQGVFDICASSFAQDTELSSAQLNDLPPAALDAIGYSKPKPVAQPVAPKP